MLILNTQSCLTIMHFMLASSLRMLKFYESSYCFSESKGHRMHVRSWSFSTRPSTASYQVVPAFRAWLKPLDGGVVRFKRWAFCCKCHTPTRHGQNKQKNMFSFGYLSRIVVCIYEFIPRTVVSHDLMMFDLIPKQMFQKAQLDASCHRLFLRWAS